jgi:type II secretory pathway component PulF
LGFGFFHHHRHHLAALKNQPIQPMLKFTYTARDRTGHTVTSTLDSPSRKDALRHLAARGLQPQRIEEINASGAVVAKPAKKIPGNPFASPGSSSAAATAAPTAKQLAAAEARLSRTERLPFLDALADPVASGLSAGASLRMPPPRTREPKLRALCSGLWGRIGEGATLSRAMGEFPKVFDSQTINLIQAGEATGGLGEVLNRLISHLTEQKELRRQFVTALAYPALLVTAAFAVVLFFLFFLIPQMQNLFAALGGNLPAATRILVGMSEFVLHYGILVAGFVAFVVIAFWRWRKTKQGRFTTDGWLLRSPITKNFVSSQTVLSFSQTLSVLLENGITTTEALKITERQITNTVHQAAFNEASGHVMEGEALSSALQRTDCFPPLVLDQLAIGENTGSLVPSLKKIAASYRKIVSSRLSSFMTLITSAVLLCTFSFIGFIAFAIVTAIFKLSSAFQM